MSDAVSHFKSKTNEILENFKPIFLKEKNNPEALLKAGIEFAAVCTALKTNSLNSFGEKANDSSDMDAHSKNLIDSLWLLAR